jgi:pyridoxamine 5'-phosphate oxidase
MSSSPIIPPSPSAEAYAGGARPDDVELRAGPDPLTLFAEWLGDAGAAEPNDPNAMALATVDADGVPDVRMVLLKDVSQDGFVFYTNTLSRKGRHLQSVAAAGLCFHWKSLRRQVRASGPVVRTTDEEADAYFSSRARDSRIGAWASKQSAPMEGRFELEGRIAAYAARFAVGAIPRPPHWGGYRLIPQRIEFWRDRPFRLHDRIEYTRSAPGEAWNIARLYP